ncbi:hypothetical protein EDD22DRAFT_958507 [Suillus occidentalis]|nr:hypothetical protein EDD22DRAFT_958507 [Suillus occidentalis]
METSMETSNDVFLGKCFTFAKAVIKQMIEVLAPSGLMRVAPDGRFVFASFASAFMLKLLCPEFAQLLTRQVEDEIFELIGRPITTLQDVAIDERPTPRLMAHIETLSPQSPNVVPACTSTGAHHTELHGRPPAELVVRTLRANAHHCSRNYSALPRPCTSFDDTLGLATSALLGFPLDVVVYCTALTLTHTTPSLIRVLRPIYARKEALPENQYERDPSDGAVTPSTDLLDVHIAFVSCNINAVSYILASATTYHVSHVIGARRRYKAVICALMFYEAVSVAGFSAAHAPLI